MIASHSPHCPVCSTAVDDPAAGNQAVTCSACGVPHHGECWDYNKKCGIFACGNDTPTGEGGAIVPVPPVEAVSLSQPPAPSTPSEESGIIANLTGLARDLGTSILDLPFELKETIESSARNSVRYAKNLTRAVVGSPEFDIKPISKDFDHVTALRVSGIPVQSLKGDTELRTYDFCTLEHPQHPPSYHPLLPEEDGHPFQTISAAEFAGIARVLYQNRYHPGMDPGIMSDLSIVPPREMSKLCYFLSSQIGLGNPYSLMGYGNIQQGIEALVTDTTLVYAGTGPFDIKAVVHHPGTADEHQYPTSEPINSPLMLFEALFGYPWSSPEGKEIEAAFKWLVNGKWLHVDRGLYRSDYPPSPEFPHLIAFSTCEGPKHPAVRVGPRHMNPADTCRKYDRYIHARRVS